MYSEGFEGAGGGALNRHQNTRAGGGLLSQSGGKAVDSSHHLQRTQTRSISTRTIVSSAESRILF